MSAVAEIEAQIRVLRLAIERRPDIDELVARLEERETMLARVRATIAVEPRGVAKHGSGCRERMGSRTLV